MNLLLPKGQICVLCCKDIGIRTSEFVKKNLVPLSINLPKTIIFIRNVNLIMVKINLAKIENFIATNSSVTSNSDMMYLQKSALD